jgi:flagella basal body P-ring formation protein FlgA
MIHSLLLCLALLGPSERPNVAAPEPPGASAAADSGAGRQSAARVTVTLHSEAKLRGTEVSVSDVAIVSGADAAANARVAALPLGWCPSPGYSRVIDAARILEAAQAKAPDVVVVVAGSIACRVFPREARIAPQTLALAARTEIERALRGSDYELELVELPRELAVPEGNQPAQSIGALERAPGASGSLTVPVRVLVDGQLFRTVQTSWNVRLFQTAPVLAHAVRAGEPLDASFFVQQRVEVQDIPRGVPVSPQALLGSIAARNLSAGATVSSLDVHRPVVLRSGDLVTLRVRKGGVSAELRAIARSSGSVGETITVTAETGREVPAVIVAAGVVELVMSKPR